jgi:hypothetical protein
MLSETVAENRQKVEAEIVALRDQPIKRTQELLQVVAYNLEKLERHLKAARQALNNLRKLRKVLLAGAGACQDENDQLDMIEVTDRVA